jgi:hypothetical protein
VVANCLSPRVRIRLLIRAACCNLQMGFTYQNFNLFMYVLSYVFYEILYYYCAEPAFSADAYEIKSTTNSL